MRPTFLSAALTPAIVLAALVASPAQAALDTGATAPNFRTTGAMAGRLFTLRLSDRLKHGPVVLYFFPAAFTGGCNAEAAAFAQSIDKFKAEGATVIGMSADPTDKLQKFSTAHCAGKFPVATASAKVVGEYDVAMDANAGTSAGAPAPMTNRTSYVIAPDGKIIYALTDGNPADHITGTLAAVRDWRAAHPRG